MTKNKKAYFAGGCFWCIEAVFTRLKGVSKTTSGYIDGIETVEIEYNPTTIGFKTILEVFFSAHDPTSKDKQGADVGKQYRSTVFYTDEEQKTEANKYIKTPIVTTLKPLTKFTKAQDHHQKYYQNNPQQPYCKLVIDPKIKKLQKNFKPLLKQSHQQCWPS